MGYCMNHEITAQLTQFTALQIIRVSFVPSRQIESMRIVSGCCPPKSSMEQATSPLKRTCSLLPTLFNRFSRVPLAGWLLVSCLVATLILMVSSEQSRSVRIRHCARSPVLVTSWLNARPLSFQSQESCRPRQARSPVGTVTAYLIMVHTLARLEGARQLLEQIFDPSDLFFIHADAAIDLDSLKPYKEAMSVCDNVHFILDDQRLRGRWGSWSLVEIELVLLRQALASSTAWDQVILLDGSTWPIGGAADRQAWLQEYRKLLNAGGDPQHRPFACRRPEWCQNRHVKATCKTESCTSMWNTVDDAVIYKRSQFFVLPRSAVEYMTYGPAAEEWMEYFRNTTIPDEHWSVTVQYAQPGGPTGGLPDPVGTIWGQCLAHPADWSPHPCTLGMADLPRVRPLTSPFVRKVELGEMELKQVLARGEEKQIRFPLAKRRQSGHFGNRSTDAIGFH